VGRVLLGLGVPPSDVDDALQEVFVVAARRIDGYEERGAVRSWLYAIALHVARASRRDRSRLQLVERQSTTGMDPAAPAGEGPEAAVENCLDLQRANKLLELLTVEQRQVFILYEVEQLTLREIAAIQQCPLQTAYSRLHAARERLREAVVTQGENHEAQ
jgi:RNA polymerase sigma-70 factor, ECF subfamily